MPESHGGTTEHSRAKVALVVDAIHPYSHGGREVRYHELTSRLSGLAEFHVYTMRWWPGRKVRKEHGVTFHAISPMIPMYVKERRSIVQAMIFSLCCLRLLWCRFDVLEADHIPYFQIFVLRLVATLKRKRFVVTWHEVWGKPYWRDYVGRLGSAAWFVERLAMRLPDHIVAASPETASRLRSYVGATASVVVAPNGIDLESIRAASQHASPTDLVVVGRLISHKRIGMLLEAVALLHGEGTKVTCRIVGDGPEADTLHQDAIRLGIGHAVDFQHDVREQSEVYSLVKAAQIFVFPSDREGFGAAVLEAIACGVAVITTSSPDNLSQHLALRASRGVVCDPSAAALARSIKNILDDPDQQRPSPGGAGDAWLAEYSWEAVADRVAMTLGLSQ